MSKLYHCIECKVVKENAEDADHAALKESE
jgi:hypothetical protein